LEGARIHATSIKTNTQGEYVKAKKDSASARGAWQLLAVEADKKNGIFVRHTAREIKKNTRAPDGSIVQYTCATKEPQHLQ
jgi:hypothetical protein